jgi:hypothetical protein
MHHKGGRLRANDVPALAAPVTYSTGAAAKITGLSQQTIIRCFDTGHLAGFRVPGSKFRRITRSGLLAFMLEHGIPLDALGMLSDEERAQVEKVGGVVVEQTRVGAPSAGGAPVNRIVGLTDSLTSS